MVSLVLSFVERRLTVDGDVDGVWDADDDAGDEDEDDGELRPMLIAPYNAHLRKPAIIHNLHITVALRYSQVLLTGHLSRLSDCVT